MFLAPLYYLSNIFSVSNGINYLKLITQFGQLSTLRNHLTSSRETSIPLPAHYPPTFYVPHIRLRDPCKTQMLSYPSVILSSSNPTPLLPPYIIRIKLKLLFMSHNYLHSSAALDQLHSCESHGYNAVPVMGKVLLGLDLTTLNSVCKVFPPLRFTLSLHLPHYIDIAS